MALLEIKGLSKNFGGLRAVDNLDLEVFSGEIVGLIGPNGAGKTTVFNLISGFLKPSSGKVIFKGKDITNLKPHKIAEEGIARTFQLTSLFPDMTTAENLYVAVHLQSIPSFFGSIFGSSSSCKKENELQEKAMSLMQSMRLSALKDAMAKNLPHGQQRLLSIAMAIATNPKIVLLDEPVSGMNYEETRSTMNLIKKIQDRGVTVFLVEHNMRAVMEYCDRIAVLNYGNKITEGTPKEIREHEEVIRAYLGHEEAA